MNIWKQLQQKLCTSTYGVRYVPKAIGAGTRPIIVSRPHERGTVAKMNWRARPLAAVLQAISVMIPDVLGASVTVGAFI